MYVIYQIKNVLDNKIYIGSAKNFGRRKSRHLTLLRQNKHHSKHLQNAFNLHGQDSFIFEIVQEIEHPQEVYEIENQFIKLLKPEYNMMQDVFSHIGLKRSKETCERISKALTGKKLSDEHREKTRLANFGKKQSEETIKKRMVNNYKPIITYNMDGSVFKEFPSATHAAKELGIKLNCIYQALWGKKLKSYKNLKWERI